MAGAGSGPEAGQTAPAGGRTRRWLEERRRDRARKHMRRKIRKALQQLWVIETTLGRQGLMSTPVHLALQRTLKALDEFQRIYDQHTAG